jgi:hypothetical protein
MGSFTNDYIDYNRQDVLATQGLLNALKNEFDRHPIDLYPTAAYSPASISKAYLQALGLTPPLSRAYLGAVQLGQAISAYYGGRAECRIRKTIVPVVYLDFLSMYPTANTLMDMWTLLTAEKIETIDATDEAQALLDSIRPDDCFDPATWPDLRFFAEIVPDGDLLPVRAQYDPTMPGYNIGINPFTTTEPAWYAGPDLVAAKLLGGKTPRIRRAFRVIGHGAQEGLQSARLRDHVPIDPTSDDFFKTVIEARKKVERDPTLSEEERERISASLKVVANSGSYGIFAEMNPQDQKPPKRLTVYGSGDPFKVTAIHEAPGPYCFPPFAALITAAARLMLALLEYEDRWSPVVGQASLGS